MSRSASAASLLAPNGTLRAAINLGNAVLARRDAVTGKPVGITVDIAQALAEHLGVPLELIVVTAAVQSVDAVDTKRSDVGFFAIDPIRGATIAFTEPYLDIEGWYAVREESPIQTNSEVDRPGNRVAVGNGSAYDLFLTRKLQHAEIVRGPNPQSVTSLFFDQGLEVLANVRQQIEHDKTTNPGLRLLPERFMVIRQAMGLNRDRGEEAAKALTLFLEDLKATDFLQRSMERHNIYGAVLVPPM